MLVASGLHRQRRKELRDSCVGGVTFRASSCV